MTTIEVFDKDINAAVDFPLTSIPEDFEQDTAAATLHVLRWPNQPGAVIVDEAPRALTVYGGVATYVTVADDFEAGNYYAQVRLTQVDAYETTVNSEIFRLLVKASV